MTPQSPVTGSHCDHGEGCITCGDVAVDMRVLSVDAGRELAVCAVADGRRETVEIALVQPIAIGDNVLVHAGTAIAKLDRDQAGGEGRPAANPAGADAGADSRSPSRGRGQGVSAGAEQPAGTDSRAEQPAAS